jgi:putative sterol carrier protein
MAIELPSEGDEWIRAWQDELNASEEYSEAGAGWGTDFNGSFLFEIQPDGTYDGDPIYLYVDLEDGECTEAREIADPDDADWGFAYRGSYEDWKALVHGEVGAIDGMMDGKFDLDGDMQKVLQYSDAAVVMTENASNIDTEFEY